MSTKFCKIIECLRGEFILGVTCESDSVFAFECIEVLARDARTNKPCFRPREESGDIFDHTDDIDDPRVYLRGEVLVNGCMNFEFDNSFIGASGAEVEEMLHACDLGDLQMIGALLQFVYFYAGFSLPGFCFDMGKL